MDPEPRQRDSLSLRERLRALLHVAFEVSNRISLPGPSVLPVAGAVVGLYGGLAAGIFANLIGLVSGLAVGLPHLIEPPQPGVLERLRAAFADASWHFEFAIVGAPLALAALLTARVMSPGGPRDMVRQRLRVLALLTLGALGLYFPLVALAALNSVFGHGHELANALSAMPWWAKLLLPAAGGAAVGRLLRDRPETHGHGVPEVVSAVQRQRDGLPAEGGLLKLVASAVTIGTGGSAGREGPIVYGGAAFGSAVGRTLGFSRRELSILLACGAGAGIAASFNTPIGGAIFALEIILRQFELKVFSPIILASVTATMVGRGVMGGAPMVRRITYQMVSGWEILGYVALGLLCGLLAYAFARLLRHSDAFFRGRIAGSLSAFLGRQPLWVRAGAGGLSVGLLILASPAVWGTGHEFVNLAAAGQLSLAVLGFACVAKLVGTAVTIGSGGSGGTFFPSLVIGAMAGGAFGELVHSLFPALTAPSGAYAVVGMGGAVAGLTRGPLTGMIMLYELTGNYAIILPLMVTCTLASALCHVLLERRAERARTERDVLREHPVRKVSFASSPVAAGIKLRELVDQLISAEGEALPVLDSGGALYGVALISELRDVWRDEQLNRMLNALDVARKVKVLSPEDTLAHALELMDQEDVDALPVHDRRRGSLPYGVVTRAAIRRFVFRQLESVREEAEPREEAKAAAAAR
ncbi:MAG: chloride channel protein [Myxococcales bacterium]|nr:chloride channel protein [Myxococcales bacterium]